MYVHCQDTVNGETHDVVVKVDSTMPSRGILTPDLIAA